MPLLFRLPPLFHETSRSTKLGFFSLLHFSPQGRNFFALVMSSSTMFSSFEHFCLASRSLENETYYIFPPRLQMFSSNKSWITRKDFFSVNAPSCEKKRAEKIIIRSGFWGMWRKKMEFARLVVWGMLC